MLRRLSKTETTSLIRNLKRAGIPFRNRRLAESFLYFKRNSDLRELLEYMRVYPELGLDFRPASLKRLESLYLNFAKGKKMSAPALKRFEELITQYMRHVLVHNGLAEWAVMENEYAEGRYELGIRFSSGRITAEDFARDLADRKDMRGRYQLFETYNRLLDEEEQVEQND